MLVHWIRLGLNNLLDLFFPNVCFVCAQALETGEEMVCTGCRLRLPETNMHLLQSQALLLSRFAGSVQLAFCYAYLYFQKRGAVQKLIHALKYKGQKEIGLTMGKWYGDLLRKEADLHTQADLIIAVPLHPAKLRQRGYNQADLFAEGLAESLCIPHDTGILIRKKYTESQTLKDRLERWENVNSVFAVINPQHVEAKRILLVDDVLTTGATLEACTVALLNAGCKSVGIVTIAAAR